MWQTPGDRDADRLILDGQQRLTSLFQALRLDQAVLTRDQRGQPIKRWYYIDMQRALDENVDREEALCPCLREDKSCAWEGRR